MSDIVRDQIAAETALIVRLVPVPTGQLAYGRDLACVTDITPTLEEVDPSSPRGVAEYALRRITTTRGSVPDAPDWGINLHAYCNAPITADQLRTIEADVRTELRDDDRIASRDVKASYSLQTRALTVTGTITPATPGATPFRFTFAITSGEAAIQELYA